jgi:hypothetical protein
VWNQVNYEPLQINEDLTVPVFPIAKNRAFNGKYPYNGALIQVPTMVNSDFSIVQPAANPAVDSLWTETDYPAVRLYVRIKNHGVRNTNASLPVALYGTATPPVPPAAGGAGYITSKSVGVIIAPDSAYVMYFDLTAEDTPPYMSVRIQDDGVKYPADGSYLDCDYSNNTGSLEFTRMFVTTSKQATLNGVQLNGTYSNPVSVLYSENVRYRITAYNAGLRSGNITIRDTLPQHMNLLPATLNTSSGIITHAVGDQFFALTIANMASHATDVIEYEATPEEGSVASQPLFINRAWVQVNDTVLQTNSTYHQGAGVSIVTFSASAGGSIYNADPQAVDYRTTARAGVLVVPDDGYRFTGWSHDGYVPHRGQFIAAASGIAHYDTLAIYGNVELTARFEPETYLIRYHLHDGENASANPPAYTVERGLITLAAPR